MPPARELARDTSPAFLKEVGDARFKLAVVIPGFQADEQDWCIPAFTNLARELSKHAEVHMFALRYPHRARSYRVGAVQVHALGGGSRSGRRVKGLSLVRLWRDFAAAFHAEHARRPFDAALGVWATESGWLASTAARKAGIGCLVHLAGGELTRIRAIGYGNRENGLSGLLVRRTLRTASLISVPSSPVEDLLPRWVPASKRVRWHPGVDTEMFAPSPEAHKSESGTFTFITVGSLIPVKGHDLLIEGLAEATRLAPECDLRLVIVGSGPLESSLRALAAELGVAGRVNFAGEVAHENLPTVYRAADAFLLGSWHEAQCMAALEGMSSGLPWVSTPVGAPVDIAQQGQDSGTRSGILVAERTPEAVAHAMITLASLPPAEKAAWGRTARAHITRSYDMALQAEQLFEILQTRL